MFSFTVSNATALNGSVSPQSCSPRSQPSNSELIGRLVRAGSLHKCLRPGQLSYIFTNSQTCEAGPGDGQQSTADATTDGPPTCKQLCAIQSPPPPAQRRPSTTPETPILSSFPFDITSPPLPPLPEFNFTTFPHWDPAGSGRDSMCLSPPQAMDRAAHTVYQLCQASLLFTTFSYLAAEIMNLPLTPSILRFFCPTCWNDHLKDLFLPTSARMGLLRKTLRA